MLSDETWMALLLCFCAATMPFLADKPADGSWLLAALLALLLFPVVRGMLWLVMARDSRDARSARDGVLARYAGALGATLRTGLLPPVIAVPILDAGDASIRFFAPSRWGMGASYMRLRLRSDALRQAPWLHLEGGQSFWLTARMLGATALTLRKPTRSWRYWRWPWRAPDRTVEGPEFCAALPATKQALVLTSRPGHLLIRADYQREPSLEFERAVNLAIAWVKAVQQTAGAPRT